jgi:hypothetical protein
MRTTLALTTLLVVGASVLPGQERRRWPESEVRPYVGAFVPVGSQRDDFEPATTVGVQVAIEMTPNVHAVANLAWSGARNRFAFLDDDTDIWQYDLGVEANLVRRLSPDWLFRPFIGAGAGGRTYAYDAPDVGRHSGLGAYGALGGEVQVGRVALRAEARDYVTSFESPTTGNRTTRSDVGMSIGVAYHFR